MFTMKIETWSTMINYRFSLYPHFNYQLHCSLWIQPFQLHKPLTTLYIQYDHVFFFSVAELLKVDSKKLSWSFLNYCVVVNGTAVRRKQTISGVYESMRVFAQTLYARLFDWIVNTINLKLSFTRAIL